MRNKNKSLVHSVLNKFKDNLRERVAVLSLVHLYERDHRLFELETEKSKQLMDFLEDQDLTEEQLETVSLALQAIIEEVPETLEGEGGLLGDEIKSVAEDTVVEFGKAFVRRLGERVAASWGLGEDFFQDIQDEVVAVYSDIDSHFLRALEENEIDPEEIFN